MTVLTYRIIDTVSAALEQLEALPEVYLEVLPQIAAEELRRITPRSTHPPNMANQWRAERAFLGNDAPYAAAVRFRADRGRATVDGKSVQLGGRSAASVAVQTLNAVQERALERALEIVLED